MDDLTDDRPLTVGGEMTFELIDHSVSAGFNGGLILS